MLALTDFTVNISQKHFVNNLASVACHLVYDTRKIVNGEQSIFIALKTSNRDGHNFIQAAYDKGVRNFIISNKDFLPDNCNAIICSDSLLLLQEQAKITRDSFNFPVVGITGSKGKTIVKEWLIQLLLGRKKIAHNKGSLNSQLGLALSLLENNNNNHELGIFEAGISLPGEMDRLKEILRPEIGLLTNIENNHLENFKNQEELANEKLKLFKDCDTLFLSQQNQSLYRHKLESIKECFTWGDSEKANININFKEGNVVYTDKCLHFSANHLPLSWQDNLSACLSIIAYLGELDQEICDRVKYLSSAKMRLEFHEVFPPYFVLNDAYILDLQSLENALTYFDIQSKNQNNLLVISEFDNHNEINNNNSLKLIDQYQIDEVFFVGEQWHNLEKLKTKHLHFKEVKSLGEELATRITDHNILLKGARKFELEKLIDQYIENQHPSQLEVNFAAIKRNISRLKQNLPDNCKFLAMIKAQAYGSSLPRVAKALQLSGADYLGVAFTDEAVALRKAGVFLPILIIHPLAHDYKLALKYNLELVAHSQELCKYWLQNCDAPLNIHLELESGMNRQGMHESEILDFEESKNIQLKGLITHLASAGVNDDYSKDQLLKFESCYNNLKKSYPNLIGHALNSEGILHYPEYAFDMVRSGMAIFGYSSSQNLESAISLKTKVSAIKKVQIGDAVGYNNSFVATEDGQIALIPLGYADAIPWSLSNQNFLVKINEKHYPIIGDICMDMCMIFIGNDKIKTGDTVNIFSSREDLKRMATFAGSTPYEILSRISSRIKRVFIDE